MNYTEKLRLIKLGELPKEAVAKSRKPIAKQSEKKKQEIKEQRKSGDDKLDIWFEERRKEMSNRCLFCGGKSERDNDETYRRSIAHLLPKAIFKSTATHGQNSIELCFFQNSCHTNFDNGTITWELIKDSKEWDVVRGKLLAILPCVSPEERKHKLYTKLCNLVYENCDLIVEG